MGKSYKEAKVVLNDGAHFGKEGKAFARLNVATPLKPLRKLASALLRPLENKKKRADACFFRNAFGNF